MHSERWTPGYRSHRYQRRNEHQEIRRSTLPESKSDEQSAARRPPFPTRFARSVPEPSTSSPNSNPSDQSKQDTTATTSQPTSEPPHSPQNQCCSKRIVCYLLLLLLPICTVLLYFSAYTTTSLSSTSTGVILHASISNLFQSSEIIPLLVTKQPNTAKYRRAYLVEDAVLGNTVASSYIDDSTMRAAVMRVGRDDAWGGASAHNVSLSQWCPSISQGPCPLTLVVPLIHTASNPNRTLQEVLAQVVQTQWCARAGTARVHLKLVAPSTAVGRLLVPLQHGTARPDLHELYALNSSSTADGDTDALAVLRAWRLDGLRLSAAPCIQSVHLVAFHASAPPQSTRPMRVQAIPYAAYVNAGLASASMTEKARATHFAVVSDFVVPTVRAAGDGVGAGAAGFLESLLLPLANNAGRVAAAQCTLLKERQQSAAVPGKNPLFSYAVEDKGGFAHMTERALNQQLIFHVVRRLNGYSAMDQRAHWMEPIDFVNPLCAVYNRAAYELVGGMDPTITPTLFSAASKFDHAHAQFEYVGWELSLRLHYALPSHWEMWSSGALASISSDDVLMYGKVSPRTQSASYLVAPPVLKQWAPAMEALHRLRSGRQWRYATVGSNGGSEVVMHGSAEERDFSTELSSAASNENRLIVGFVSDYHTSGCNGLLYEMTHYLLPLSYRRSIIFHGPQMRWCNLDAAGAQDTLFRTQLDIDPMNHRYEKLPEWKMSVLQPLTWQILFIHTRPVDFRRHLPLISKPGPHYIIGRSLSETSQVSPAWVQNIHKIANEMWVTTHFFRVVFEKVGIDPSRIHVIPEAVDVYQYDPANYKPLPKSIDSSFPQTWSSRPAHEIPDSEQFVFLSIFKWEPRKGWDVLLKAYWDAFGPHSPYHNNVTLVVKTSFLQPFSQGAEERFLGSFILSFMRNNIKGAYDLSQFPRIVVVFGANPESKIARLYKTADAFVLPTRGEGWGLPIIEAMAMGLPVITTDWSGVSGFVTRDTAFAIPLDGIEELPKETPYGHAIGKKWALPSVEGLATLMRYVFENRDHARTVGARARRHIVEHYSEEAVADLMDARFTAIMELLSSGKAKRLASSFS